MTINNGHPAIGKDQFGGWGTRCLPSLRRSTSGKETPLRMYKQFARRERSIAAISASSPQCFAPAVDRRRM